MNTTEVANITGAEILRLHQLVQSKVLNAQNGIEDAKGAAIQCGQFLEDARKQHGGDIYRWVLENVPGLEPKQAKAYLGISKTHAHRQAHAMDHRQLLMLGIVGVKEKDENAPLSQAPRANKSGRWVSWIGRIVGHFAGVMRARPLSEWPLHEREAVANQLEPLVRLMNQLRECGSTGTDAMR